jgi:hypothetical protein
MQGVLRRVLPCQGLRETYKDWVNTGPHGPFLTWLQWSDSTAGVAERGIPHSLDRVLCYLRAVMVALKR